MMGFESSGINDCEMDIFPNKLHVRCGVEDVAHEAIERTLARQAARRLLERRAIVEKARELGFISFGTVSLDGTKIQANANRNKNETQDSLEKKIRDLIQEAERIDEIEDDAFGDREDAEDPQLKTKEGREKRKQELKNKQKLAQAHLQARASLSPDLSKDTKVNTTDSDSRLMKMKRGGYANGYNVQIMTENGFVLSSHIANMSADQNLLVPSLNDFQKTHHAKPERLLADKGYSSENNFAFCEQEEIDAYIPVHQEFPDLTRYTYDKEQDAYMHEDGRIFTFKQRMKRLDTDTHNDPKSYKHIIYEHEDKGTKKKKYLCISPIWQRLAQIHKRKLDSPEGKERYKQRLPDVEGVFGNIKHNLNFTVFRLRGLTGAIIEWNLISMAHNLKKML